LSVNGNRIDTVAAMECLEMRSTLSLLLLACLLAGCATNREQREKSYLDYLYEDGYGYGNDENAAAARERIRSR
jgi:hypothetical protein